MFKFKFWMINGQKIDVMEFVITAIGRIISYKKRIYVPNFTLTIKR